MSRPRTAKAAARVRDAAIRAVAFTGICSVLSIVVSVLLFMFAPVEWIFEKPYALYAGIVFAGATAVGILVGAVSSEVERRLSD